MDRGVCWATVQGLTQKSDTTEHKNTWITRPSGSLLCLPPPLPEVLFLHTHICCYRCSVAMSCLTLLWPLWTVAHQAPLFMGCPRQEDWSGLPFPSLGDLPNPGIKPTSAWQAGSLTLSLQGSPYTPTVPSMRLTIALITESSSPTLYWKLHQGRDHI